MNGQFKYGWILLLLNQSLFSQQNFYSAVKQDSVFIFLTETPAIGQSVLIERRGPNDEDFIQITEMPIRPVLSSDEARHMLGEDYSGIAEALQTENIQQTLFLLRNDPFYGGIFTMLNRRVGRILGRFFASGSHQPGTDYVYRVRLVDRRGNTLQILEKTIRIAENRPKPLHQIKLESQMLGMKISWEYPPWHPDSDDITVQFYLYKQIGKDFQRIKDHLLRLERTAMSFLDRNVQPGDSVCYYLTAVNAAGLESEPSEILCGRFIDIVPPSRPLGLTAQLKDGHVRLIWNLNPELDIAAYHAYRAPTMTAAMSRINKDPVSADDPWFIDATCQPRNKYFYAVTATDSSGNESPASNRVSIWIEDRMPPSPPLNLHARPYNHQIRLAWQSASDPDIQGYRVYRGFSEETLYALSEALIPDTVYIDGTAEKLQPGRHYYYAVTVVDSSWHESEKTDIWVTLPDDQPPRKPGDVRAVTGANAMRIIWNPSPSTDISLYRLTRLCNGTTLELERLPATVREWTDTTVVKGETCQYSITAVDTAGNESEPALSAKVMMRDYDPPHCPRFLQAKAEKSGVIIQWERIAASDLAGYRVFRAEIETGIYQPINDTLLSGLTLNDKEGQPHHWYRVRAVDTSGNESDFSQSVPAIASEK
ncbi:hypothetical protein JW835_08855 [bacterium]|nr:hypothetical protein [bacterium]